MSLKNPIPKFFFVSQKKYVVLIGVLFFLTLIMAHFVPNQIHKVYSKRSIKELQKNVIESEKKLDELVNNTKAEDLIKNPSLFEELKKECDENNLVLLFLNKNNLEKLIWTSTTAFPKRIFYNFNFPIFVTLDNGFYLQKEYNSNESNFLTIGLMSLQYNYQTSNQYLKNANSITSSIDYASFEISNTSEYSNNPIKDVIGNVLFNINDVKINLEHRFLFFILIALLISYLIALTILLRKYIFENKILLSFIIYILNLILIISIWKFFLPDFILTSSLFDKEIYNANFLVSSLGDYFFVTIIIAHTFFSWYNQQLIIQKIINYYLVLILIIIFAHLQVILLHNSFSSLILNSSLNLELSNLYNINQLSILAFCLFFIQVLSFGIYLNWIHKFMQNKPFKVTLYSVVIIVLISILFFAFQFFSPYINYLSIVFVLFLTLIPGIFRFEISKSGVIKLLVFIFFSSIFITIESINAHNAKDIEEQKALAKSIISREDETTENLFSKVENKISKHPELINYITNPIIEHRFIEDNLNELFFKGFFTGYDIGIFIFTEEGFPLKNNFYISLSKYDDIINSSSKSKIANYLYLTSDYSTLPYYIAKIPVYQYNKIIGYVIIELKPGAYQEKSIYPELLLSSNKATKKTIEDYSFAVYENGNLKTLQGSYPYPERIDVFTKEDLSIKNILPLKNNYLHKHYLDLSRKGIQIIVSFPAKSVLSYVANFVYTLLLFLIFIAISLIFIGFIRVLKLSEHLPYLYNNLLKFRWLKIVKFRTKVLGSILVSMSLALIAIGAVTVYYISNEYTKDEIKVLQENTAILANKVSSFINSNRFLNEGDFYYQLQSYIKTLSDLYKTDINYFNPKGELYITTQPLIYDYNLIEEYINPSVLIKTKYINIGQMLEKESIGKLEFSSSYFHITDENGNSNGFINLPYFFKDKALSKKISTFIVALVNLYVLLFIILIFIGLGISNMVTAPLRLIREHLKFANIETKPKPLRWRNSEDEIGKLVQEYNNLLSELKKSADALANSQKEVAWREMAKQVAHEIKNPLTPMKLNIQRLQLIPDKSSDKFLELFNKVSNILINQIESLSQIAQEFSEFAKMPIGDPNFINLNEVCSEIVELHRLDFQYKNIEVSCNFNAEISYVHIDRNHLGRMIDNLLRNAAQAIPSQKKGKIDVTTSVKNQLIMLSIKDNGMGIPKNIQEHLFTPNFSTKTSGMGLGLSIVKNIIEKAEGTITYKTEENIGTEFIVSFPLSKKTHS
jgi:signal transduction histidine kinase